MYHLYPTCPGTPIKRDGSCYYTESLSLSEHNSTHYFRILRVGYVKDETNEPPLQKISYKTITPMQFFPDGADNPPDIERFPDLINGLHEWLAETGIHKFTFNFGLSILPFLMIS